MHRSLTENVGKNPIESLLDFQAWWGTHKTSGKKIKQDEVEGYVCTIWKNGETFNDCVETPYSKID